jgi:hypothetical protein
MARLYFHLHECGHLVPDEEGQEVVDLQDARDRAIRAARDVMCAEVQNGKLCLGCCIIIADADNKEVDRIPFRDTVSLSGAEL